MVPKLGEPARPGGTDGTVFIVPTFMHFQMKHESPEEPCQSVGKGQAEPQGTTNKQPSNNDCVRSGAGLNVLKPLVHEVLWPPTDGPLLQTGVKLTHC